MSPEEQGPSTATEVMTVIDVWPWPRAARGPEQSPRVPKVTASTFRRQPLDCLDRLFPDAGDAFWVPGRQLIVAHPQTAKDILSNRQGLYEEHSDFFHTRRGTLGPRTFQIAVGKALRTHLSVHLETQKPDLDAALDRLASMSTPWPQTGNRLIFEHLLSALVGFGDANEEALLRDIVERAVLAGALKQHSRWSRWRFRRRVARELAAAIRRRQGRSVPPVDILGALAAAGSDIPVDDLAEVLLSTLFAAAGSIGFTLGWCLYLLGTHEPGRWESGWVVREALRLWPIAWMLGRRPTEDFSVLGHEVTPGDLVVVCTYLLHRHPRYWDESQRFRPDRWDTRKPPAAYLPFGWGSHFCAAATLTLDWLETILDQLLTRGWPRAAVSCTQPQVGPALAPPEFTLTFEDSLERR